VASRPPSITSLAGHARTCTRPIELPRRGHLRITSSGLEALKTNPPKINIALLEQHLKFRSRDKEPMLQAASEIAAMEVGQLQKLR